jgi:hypothetical protein
MKRIVFPREVLLIEVERRCGEPLCGARVKLSLTKADARAFTGFECERCGRWFADALTERDIPEWWEELNVASLRGLKPSRESAGKRKGVARDSMSAARNALPSSNRDLKPAPREVSKPAPQLARAVEEDAEEDDAEVVARMSKAWRRLGMGRESEPEVAKPEGAEDKRGDSF